MATLQYDFAVINEGVLGKSLARHRREVDQHNRIVARSMRRDTVPTAANASRTAAREDVRRERSAKAEIALQAKAKRDQEQAERRAAAERIRNERRAAVERERSLSRDIAARKAYDRVAERSQRDRDRATHRATRDAAIVSRAYQRNIRGKVERGVGAISAVGSRAVSAVGLAGAGLVAAGVYGQVEKQKLASQLANQAGRPELKGALVEEADRIRGFSGAEALGALERFTSLTGDLDAGRSMLAEIGNVALATSTDIGDLASAAGNAFIPLNDAIRDPTERMKAMQTVIRSMAGMGAVGAVEIKDLASEMAGLAAQATKFRGGPQRAMQTAVMMAQAARQRGGAASAAEAVTSVERFSSDLLTKQADLRRMGVEVFTDKTHTQLRSQEDIIQDVLARTGGDLGKIGGIFGERSIRAIQGFSPLYTAAEREKKGSGRAAVAAEMARLMQATLSEEGLQKRVASRLQDPDVQLRESWKALSAAAGKELLPVLTQLVPEFAKLVPGVTAAAKVIADFAKWGIQNPWKGIGLVLSAALIKEIGGAAIGKAVANTITRMLASGGAPAPAGTTPAAAGAAARTGGKVTAGQAVGAALTGAAVGIPLAALIDEQGTTNFDRTSKTLAEAQARVTGTTGAKQDIALAELLSLLRTEREKDSGLSINNMLTRFGAGTEAELAGAEEFYVQTVKRREWDRKQRKQYGSDWENVQAATQVGMSSVDTAWERSSSASWIGSQARYMREVSTAQKPKDPTDALTQIATKLDGVLDVNVVSGSAGGNVAMGGGGPNRGTTPTLGDLGLNGLV